jgi:hypothetical protein
MEESFRRGCVARVWRKASVGECGKSMEESFRRGCVARICPSTRCYIDIKYDYAILSTRENSSPSLAGKKVDM